MAAAVGLLTLAVVVGCGPSRAERANQEVERLTRQATMFFEFGQLDDAQQTIDEALAVEGATQREKAVALAKQIDDERRRIETEQFNRQATAALTEAIALNENQGSDAAMALVVRSVPQTSTTERELAETLVRRVREITADAGAVRYWEGFELAELVDFREKDRLPADWSSTVADAAPHGDALRQLRQATLRRTLPEALAVAEKRADAAADPDRALPAPTIEEVAADPESWSGKQVRFERVWIEGNVRTSFRQGRLLTVTSAAGKMYEPHVEEGALIFSTYGDVAGRLKSLVAEDERAQGCLFCKIVRARKSGTATSFYRAMVFKVALYTDEPAGGQQP